MKKLNAIRLLNWYHILDETLSIDGSTLFMGDNGSGKSTILDAIQFALVADLSQVRFNQAANEQAARNLQSYTRWMANTEGGKESHRYHRGDCASYVLLEFVEKTGESELFFTVGAAVDSYKDGREPNRLHFILNEGRVNDIALYRENSRHPLSSSEFRQVMGLRKGFYYSREPGVYRDTLLTRLGRLSPDFTKLLVKAQAFKPLGQVQQFVMDFLLDPRPLETQSLQANLSHYKSLEAKSLEAAKRITQLERIGDLGTELERVRDEIRSHRYMEMRALAGVQEVQITEAELGLDKSRSELTTLEGSIAYLKDSSSQTELELGSLYRALTQHSGYLERERVLDQIRQIRGEAKRVEQEIKQARESGARLTKISAELKKLLPIGAAGTEVGADYKELAYLARRQNEEHRAQLAALKTEGETLQKKLDDIKKGVKPTSKESRNLQALIEDKLRCKAPLLCDLLEVEDERWQAAVEGYLNTRRFDILVEPKYFLKALSLYDKMKRQLDLHGVGIIDAEKSAKTEARAKKGSLADVVSGVNEWAKAHIDFLLGDVIRCEDEKDLRKHSRSITPTCMVYQGHAARQTPFHVFDSWYIGGRGNARLAEQTEKAIAEVFERFKEVAACVELWTRVVELALAGEQCAERASKLLELTTQEKAATSELNRLEEHLARVDTAEIQALELRQEELRATRERLTQETQSLLEALGGAKKSIELLEVQKSRAVHERDARFGELALEFGADSHKAKALEFEKRYAKELEKGRDAQEVHRVFEATRRGRETLKANVLEQLAGLRADYNNQFGFSAPMQGEDVTPYAQELVNWRDSLLPDYRQKIERAKDSALQQLMEDIVHKLRENLDLIPDQFSQINRALLGFHFGYDQYQFTHRVKKEFAAFEGLIREAAQYETQPLFESNWKERFKTHGALEALFNSLITGSSTQVKDELAQYSDYRQYYEYDLKIMHSDGTHSFYSQVNRWKSGGETQTPYYIAVLASLYRLYRLQPDQRGGTIGLVILDEAFNKMDEDHLRATLEFTRKLGLQLIMATPKERAEFIIPFVETCWIVAKDPQTGRAFVLDFHQELPGQELPEQELPTVKDEGEGEDDNDIVNHAAIRVERGPAHSAGDPTYSG